MDIQDNLRPRLTIQTPEQVEFEYEFAGLGSRILAFLFDGLIRALIFSLLFIVVIASIVIAKGTRSFFKDLNFLFDRNHHLFAWLWAIIIFIFYLINTAYFILFETIWSGQSPGKKVLGLRVIRDGGYPIGFYEAAIRNFFRIVDALPANYLVGAVSILFSSKEKRIGDYAAGTVVIKEKTGKIPEAIFKATGSAVGLKELEGVIPKLANVTKEEYNMALEFLERKEQMDSAYRRQMAEMLTGSLAKKLNFTIPEGVSGEDFLFHFAEIYRKQMKFI